MRITRASVIATATAFSALLSTPSYAACTVGPYISMPTATYSDTVTAAQNVSLYANSAIYSTTGVYKLIFQVDGNLVLYKNGSQVIWAVNVQNCIPTPNVAVRARFETDGNLSIYYALQNNPTQEFSVWSTNTQGHPNSRLIVQNDGNVVIYDSNNSVVWAIRH